MPRFTHLLMIDTEFTSLTAGPHCYVREVAGVLIPMPTGANPRLREGQTYSDSWPVPAKNWDKDTLKWAKETYRERDFLNMTAPASIHRMKAGLDAFFDQINRWVNTLGPRNVIVMFNHPESDIPKLLQHTKSQIPWHYRNVQDLQSVVWGLCNYDEKMFDYIYKLAKESYGAVRHTALADCYSQIHILNTALIVAASGYDSTKS